MARIRSQGNRSTERRLRMLLVSRGIRGWELLPHDIIGNPDFVFRRAQLAVFVDGCFWHACARCYVKPASNRGYWSAKMRRTRARDRARRVALRRAGWSVLTIWEHELVFPPRVARRVEAAFRRIRLRPTPVQ